MKAVLLNTRVVQMKAEAGGIRVTLRRRRRQGRGEQVFDRVLVSVGRRPNCDDPGLDRTRVKVERPRLHRRRRAAAHRRTVDLRDRRRRRRADARAQGVARRPGRRRSDAGRERRVRSRGRFRPSCSPIPELAWAGLTEAQAEKEGRKVVVAKFPWGASGRAITLDRTDGLTKLIFDPETERVLGVGLVGPGAGELIAEGVLAIEMGANATDLKLSIHPHPTLTETVMESAEVFFGQATHVYRPKR